MSEDPGDFEAHEAAAMAPGMKCGVCDDEIIWRTDRKRWEHIGVRHWETGVPYEHEADGPGPVRGNTPRRTIRAADALWDAAQAKAADQGTDLSSVIRKALERYVKRR